ncbi:unnamed protein product, partial [Owenia fusiformis]
SLPEMEKSKNLLELPDGILENVLSYLSYDNISQCRIICKKFNAVCKQQLNHGFARVDKFHAQCQKDIKVKLPRRESERRSHPLSRHVDILAAIETRLSLLTMTFCKYIDSNLCCFIPGKVLDEIFRVLRMVRKEDNPPRAHELLQELRDISSMAMEFFDDKIAPGLKQHLSTYPLHNRVPVPSFGSYINSTPIMGQPSTSGGNHSNQGACSMPTPNMRQPSLRYELNIAQKQIRNVNVAFLSFKKELQDCKNLGNEQKKKIQDQERQITTLTRHKTDMNNKFTKQESKVNDLTKKIQEYDGKFSDLITEITKLKEFQAKHMINISIQPNIELESKSSIEGSKEKLTPGRGNTRKRKQTVVKEEGKVPITSPIAKRTRQRKV